MMLRYGVSMCQSDVTNIVIADSLKILKVHEKRIGKYAQSCAVYFSRIGLSEKHDQAGPSVQFLFVLMRVKWSASVCIYHATWPRNCKSQKPEAF